MSITIDLFQEHLMELSDAFLNYCNVADLVRRERLLIACRRASQHIEHGNFVKNADRDELIALLRTAELRLN